MITVGKVVFTIVVAVIVRWGWKLLNWAWLKPKKLEKSLREQGFKGNSYRLLKGDAMELARMTKEARSTPMTVSHDITSHVLPFEHYISNKYAGPIAIRIQKEQMIFRIQKEQMDLVVQLLFTFYVPGGRLIPTKANKKFKENRKELQVLAKGIVENRKKAIEMGEDNNNDLLGILLASNSKEIKENGVGLSIEDVIKECKLFYIAGSETTSNLIIWTMVCLSLHQEWQDKARQEILEALGSGELHFEGLKHLKIVTMILNEVLRLYPPVVRILRETHNETKLGGMTLPSGVNIIIPIIRVHHDPEIWGEDATEFKPERFSEGVANATKGRGSGCFLPFGGGPKVCIGQNLAVVEAKAAIAKILQRFSFELSPSYKHSPAALFSLPPQFGAHLILHKI